MKEGLSNDPVRTVKMHAVAAELTPASIDYGRITEAVSTNIDYGSVV